MRLYDISKNYENAFLAMAEMDDLPEDVINDTLEGIEGEFKEKGLAVAAYFQNLESQAEAIRVAEKRMSDRRKALEAKANNLKAYLKKEMERIGVKVIESPEFDLKIKKCPPSVRVDDESKVPDDFKKEKVTVSIDKTAIKKAGGCEGVTIVSGTRLDVK